MPMEVALLEWGTDRGGVRLIGRSGDREMVDAVRRHLVEQLDEDHPTDGSAAQLRLVQPADGDEGDQP